MGPPWSNSTSSNSERSQMRLEKREHATRGGDDQLRDSDPEHNHERRDARVRQSTASTPDAPPHGTRSRASTRRRVHFDDLRAEVRFCLMGSFGVHSVSSFDVIHISTISYARNSFVIGNAYLQTKIVSDPIPPPRRPESSVAGEWPGRLQSIAAAPRTWSESRASTKTTMDRPAARGCVIRAESVTPAAFGAPRSPM